MHLAPGRLGVLAVSAARMRSCSAKLSVRWRGLSCRTSAETLRGKASLISRMTRVSRSLPATSWISVWNRSFAACEAGLGGASPGRSSSLVPRSSSSASRVIRLTARTQARPSSSARTSYASRTSHGAGTRTTAPRLGTTSIRPPACNWRSASRTGVRLTPSVLASSAWRSCAPIGISPDMIRARMAAAVSSTSALPVPNSEAVSIYVLFRCDLWIHIVYLSIQFKNRSDR